MRIVTGLILSGVLLVGAQAGPLDPPKTDAERWQAAVEQGRAEKIAEYQARIKEVNKEITGIRRSKATGTVKREKLKPKKEQLAEVKRRIRTLKDDTIPFIPVIECEDLVVGVLGGFGHQTSGRVFQVLDENEMLVELKQSGMGWTTRRMGGQLRPVMRPIVLCKKTVCFRGFDTTKRIDGQAIDLRSYVVDVSGTTNYPTIIGATNQVYVLEPFVIPPKP